ncbi:hypothetical protein [Massilia antarctica]|uniref:hypothetical protein n=1 Tax=Massilia antarctica TaxID=2765360 RepID=UPI0035EE21A5
MAVMTGSATLSLGTVAAAALGSAVGSIASQTVGIMMGMQDSINWSAVGASALGGAISAGVAGWAANSSMPILGGSQFYNIAARAALGSALTQGISSVTKMQDGFKWRNVAAAGIAAGAAAGVSQAIGGSFGTGFFGDVARGTVSGIVAGAMVRMFTGGKFNMTRVATDAFGNAFGNALGNSLGADHNNDASESRLDAIGDDIENGPRFADAGLDQRSRLFNPDSDGDIRNDWGSGEGAVPENARVIVHGKRLGFFETIWSYAQDAGNAVVDFVSGAPSSNSSGYGTAQSSGYFYNLSPSSSRKQSETSGGTYRPSIAGPRNSLENFSNTSIGRANRVLGQAALDATGLRMTALDAKGFNLTMQEQIEYAGLNSRRNSQAGTLSQIDRQLRQVTKFSDWTPDEWHRTNEEVLMTLGSLGAAKAIGGLPRSVGANRVVVNSEAPLPGSVLMNVGEGGGPLYDPAKLTRILTAAEKQGATVMQGSEAERLLKAIGAKAAYFPAEGGPGTFIFSSSPTRSEVLEELMHFGQYKKAGFPTSATYDGRVQGIQFEIEAQRRLGSLAERRNWSPSEIAHFRSAEVTWQSLLDDAIKKVINYVEYFRSH